MGFIDFLKRSLCILLTIAALTTTVSAAPVNTIDFQSQCITYIMSSWMGKREVIDYWLKRMFIEYRTSQLNSYINSEPTGSDIMGYSNRIIAQLSSVNITQQEALVFLKDNWKDLIIYNVEGVEKGNPRFTIIYNGDAVIKECYPNAKISVGEYEVKAQAAKYKEAATKNQSGMYTSLEYYSAPSRITSPIRNITVDAVVSSKYGDRGDLLINGNDLSDHTGIDLAMPKGTEIVAAKSGTVRTANYGNTGYGNWLMIDHGGYYTLYAHCSKLLVQEGWEVAEGQVIAQVGSTGWSTGPHLHFEIIAGGGPIDPYNFIKQNEGVKT